MERQPIGRTRGGCLALLILAASTWTQVLAQDGPPPHVRRSVEAVVELLEGHGDATIQAFIETAMVPSPDRDPARLLASLRSLREFAGGLTDAVSVEGEPDGVRLILGGGGRQAEIRVALGPEGISSLERIEPEASADAPATKDAAVRRHVEAMETSARGGATEVLRRFEQEHLSPVLLERMGNNELRDTIRAMRAASADAEQAGIDVRDGRFLLSLRGRRSHEIAFTVADDPPFLIDGLEITSRDLPAPSLRLTRENLASTFERLEREGMSGVVHVRLGGEVVLERPFGMANAERAIPVSLDTIFGTGSRPIDYTIVSIYLLEQQGRLKRSDTIDRHLDGVPADKRTMTIEHLLTGRSGLPDFFDTAEDWDADLAWVDRATAVRRMMAQPLRFAPGTDHAHSHGGYGLLAAVVERVSGQTYASFVRENIFEPAGMTRTGFYGESLGLGVEDFAVGGGPSFVGLPNIPPNWGPTSWLVMGSGGMYSTLGDLQRFYRFVREGKILEDRYARRYRGGFASLDGSDRGFELFHVHAPPGDEAILMVNRPGGSEPVRELIGAIHRLVDPGRAGR